MALSCMYNGKDTYHRLKNPCTKEGPYKADAVDSALLLCPNHLKMLERSRAAKKEQNEKARQKRKSSSSSSSEPVSTSCGHSKWMRESTARLQNELANPDGELYNATIKASDLFAKDANGSFTCRTSFQQLILANGFAIIQGALPCDESNVDEIMALTRSAWDSIANKVCVFHSI